MVNNFVYFIRDNRSGLIKIGQSRNPTQRKMALGESSHLEILATMPAHSLERELHVTFRRHRVHGEWFNPVPELLTYIEENAGRPDIAVRYDFVTRSSFDMSQQLARRQATYQKLLTRVLYMIIVIDIKLTASWRRFLIRCSRFERARIIHRNGKGVEILAPIAERGG